MRRQPFAGVEVPPYFRVLPGRAEGETGAGVTCIRLEPSAAFGDGTHETTQLCLLALGAFSRAGFTPRTVLDFGAGSGILAIAAALAGARVEAVEIDAGARDVARVNARLNAVEATIELHAHLAEPAATFELILANVLRQVLLDFAEPLCVRQSRHGRMVLSGLLATDVPAILARYRPILAPMRGAVYERGDWRAVVFEPEYLDVRAGPGKITLA